MARILQCLWRDDDGVLSFEWTLIVVLVVVGIVSGVTAARDVVIDELGDTAEALLAWDQSYSFSGFGTIPASTYTDPGHTFADCTRNLAGNQNYRADND